MSTRSLFGACAVALALLSASTAAAQIVTTPTKYSASKCWSERYDQVSAAYFTRSDSAKTIKNTSSGATLGTYRVLCPISKKTSGPDVTLADGILKVEVPLKSAGQVSCTLETRRIPINADGNSDGNVVGPVIAGSGSANNTTITINTPPDRPTNYWTANNWQAGLPAWYYSFVACTLAPGATIGEYTVTEIGPATGATIDPMFSCPFSSDMHWRLEGFPGPSGPSPSGYVISQSFGGLKKFAFTCAMPNNAVVQVGLGPSGINKSGCNLNNTNLDNPRWQPVNTASQWPTETLATPWQPVMAMPIGQTNTLTCGSNTAQGDAKWFSYRVLPNPSHTTPTRIWTAQASANNGAADGGIDGNVGSRWTSNANGTTGMTYTVKLQPNTLFNQLTFDSGSDANDYPRLFSVWISYDGTNFASLGQFPGNNHFVSANFSMQSAGWVRVRLDSDIKNAAGTTRYWWSIRELNVHYNGQ